MADDEKEKLAELRRRAESARPLAEYRPGLRIVAQDCMAAKAGMPGSFEYVLSEPAGRNFAEGFAPAYSPQDMLLLGVFSGKYLNDCTEELPREWFLAALERGRLRPGKADAKANLFGVKSRKSFQYWLEKGWIPVAEGDRDARGWFQWYCRYWLGRRQPEVDTAQIARWRSFRRHAAQIQASYRRKPAPAPPTDDPHNIRWKLTHRARQRQALLQWSHDAFC